MSSYQYAHEAEMELYPGFLRGYRLWLPTQGTQRLRSPFYGEFVWRPGKNTAKCKNYGGQPLMDNAIRAHPKSSYMKAENCTCGFYAVSQIHNLRIATQSTPFHIIGSIKAYGRIVIGHMGFRAEYAEIEALAVPRPTLLGAFLSGMTTINVASHYGVPVFSSFKRLARKFPPSPELH